MDIGSKNNLNFDDFNFSVNAKEIDQIKNFLETQKLNLIKHIESKEKKSHNILKK